MPTRRDTKKIGIKKCVQGTPDVLNSNYERQVNFSVLSFIKKLNSTKETK